MATKELWLNLPVKDIAKSKAFFKTIGFEQNMAHGDTNDNACFLVGEKKSVVMLFPQDIFKSFTKHELSDTEKGSQLLISFDAASREEVDELAKKIVEAGGNLYAKPGDKDDWMYGCAFADLDGHRWNVLYMDMSKRNNKDDQQNKDCIIIHAIVNADAEKVWEYWTDPKHIVKWNQASDDWHTVKAENDLRIGGLFSSRMEAKDGSVGFDFCGHYTHINPMQDIAYLLGDSRKVNIHFEKTPDGIKITETFETEKENTIERQRFGWQAILNNFKNYTESN